MVARALQSFAFVAAISLRLASAQGVLPVSSITYAGSYDLATGTFVPAAVEPGHPGDDVSTVLYDNTALNGFLLVGASGAIATNHHMDWGTLPTGGSGAVITQIRIGYATLLTAPNPVGLRVRLYKGATGNGDMGAVVGDYVLTGLPNSLSASYEGFVVDVTLPSPVELDDGPFGWSYNADNPIGSPSTATGVLLVGPPNAPGTGAAKGPPAIGFGSYDRYVEATDAYVGTFAGGVTSAMVSFYVQLTGHVNGPPGPWLSYGQSHPIVVSGEGPLTPGSDDVIRIDAADSDMLVLPVASLSAADFFKPSLGLHFYAWPFLTAPASFVANPQTGQLNLPFLLDASVPPGTQVFVQVFGQHLVGPPDMTWSNGLQLTVQ